MIKKIKKQMEKTLMDYIFESGYNLNKPINNNGRFSNSNITINLEVRSSDSIHFNKWNFIIISEELIQTKTIKI